MSHDREKMYYSYLQNLGKKGKLEAPKEVKRNCRKCGKFLLQSTKYWHYHLCPACYDEYWKTIGENLRSEEK